MWQIIIVKTFRLLISFFLWMKIMNFNSKYVPLFHEWNRVEAPVNGRFSFERPGGTNQSIQNNWVTCNAYARAVEGQVTRYLTIGSGVAVAATYAMDPFDFQPSRSTNWNFKQVLTEELRNIAVTNFDRLRS